MTKKRILLVDDEPGFTRVLKLYLEKTGTYEVRDENRGEMALAAAKKFKPDLILLDIVIPDMDGGEIASNIIADETLKNTPIVFLIAAAAKNEEGMISGRPFIAKSANAEEAVQCIEKNLSKIVLTGRSIPPSAPLSMFVILRINLQYPSHSQVAIDDPNDSWSLAK